MDRSRSGITITSTPKILPLEWLGWPLTVEVEAKAKELAVARLIADLDGEAGAHAR